MNIRHVNFKGGEFETFKKQVKLIFYALLIVIVLQSCESKTFTPSGKEGEKITTGGANYYSVSAIDYYSNGIHYKIFNSANGGVFVVNITKDSIELHNFTKKGE